MHIKLNDAEPIIKKPEDGDKAPVRDEPASVQTGEIEKSRLFETHQEASGSSRKYWKILGVFAIVVAIGAGLISYFTLPTFGDAVRAPKGLEQTVRNHFLEKEKRNATDITFYYCEKFYWARVNVEKRPDITTNPIYKIDLYKARAESTGEDVWEIAATPLTTKEMDVPCS